MTKVYILVSEYNLYDQMGSYYEAVFLSKPTREELLTKCADMADRSVEGDLWCDRVMEKKGRGVYGKMYDHVWYTLLEEDV